MRRAYERVYQVARSSGLELGPVMAPADFELYPEKLADLIEEAAGMMVDEEGLGSVSDNKEDLASAASAIEDAIDKLKELSGFALGKSATDLLDEAVEFVNDALPAVESS